MFGIHAEAHRFRKTQFTFGDWLRSTPDGHFGLKRSLGELEGNSSEILTALLVVAISGSLAGKITSFLIETVDSVKMARARRYLTEISFKGSFLMLDDPILASS